MKLPNPFTATRVVLISLIALVFLSSCEKNDGKSMVKLDPEQKALEKQVSIDSLKSCFINQYFKTENRDQSKAEVAVKIRDLCENEFMYFRTVKFNYAKVPDITSPPPKMVDEELNLVEAFVERSRGALDRIRKKFNAPKNPHAPNLPPGHPPINPHQLDKPENQAKPKGI